MKTNDIDFVITWVDDTDPVWRAKKRANTGAVIPEGNEDARYRDWGTLRYWFRGVEKFAPWVRHIYFVTDDQKPEWLNVDHPKLKWVKHTDFIPEEYLPTFNSNAIEWNMHRIKGLAEQFVYFNDDMYLIDSVRAEDFFVNGLPCANPQVDYMLPSGPWAYTLFNDTYLINRHFVLKDCIQNNILKWLRFCPIRSLMKLLYFGRKDQLSCCHVPHLHTAYKKSTFETLWAEEWQVINETCQGKLRTRNDVSHTCVRMWQIMSGQFHPQRLLGKLFPTDSLSRSNAAIDYIRKQKGKVVCINDNEYEVDFELHKQMIMDAFEELLPEKSSFEL